MSGGRQQQGDDDEGRHEVGYEMNMRGNKKGTQGAGVWDTGEVGYAPSRVKPIAFFVVWRGVWYACLCSCVA